MAINVFPETGDSITEANWTALNKALSGDSNFVAEGHGLTFTTGLSVTVKSGLALVDGKLIETTTSTNKTCTASTTNYITINSSGTIQQRTSGWTAGEASIGTVVCDGTDIISISHYRPVDSDLVKGKMVENDQNKTSSTAYASISDLECPATTVGETWLVSFFLNYGAGGSGDIKIKCSPAGMNSRGAFHALNAPGTNGRSTASYWNGTMTMAQTGGGTAGDAPILGQFVLSVNNTDAAGIRVAFAQNTSNGTATTIKTGSFLVAFRIA